MIRNRIRFSGEHTESRVSLLKQKTIAGPHDCEK